MKYYIMKHHRQIKLIITTSLFLCLVGCSQSAAHYTVIHAFNIGEHGGGPMGDLLMGNNGSLYGTTAFGGANHDGTVFEIAANGKETILYSFKGGTDGFYPEAGLVMDRSGSFYGTTSEGGTSNAGTVFKITPAGKKITLYDFKGGSDGAIPEGRLMMSRNGNFYGTTSSGGHGHGGGNGTIFKITPNGKETILYRFKGWDRWVVKNSDSSAPEAGLVLGLNGNLYGTTSQGGADGEGTVFMISPTGKESILYSFKGSTDGACPEGPLLIGRNGNFYGTTISGGADDDGTVFRITPTGKESILYNFEGGTDGEGPKGGLIMGRDGNLYGTTTFGGNNFPLLDLLLPQADSPTGNGVVFEVTPQGLERVLHRYGDGSKGAGSETELVISRSGNLYGTTLAGGAHDKGVIFKIRP